MKKFLVYFLIFALLDSVEGLDSIDSIKIEQFYSCAENDESACEGLLNNGILSVDECEKHTCLIIAQIYVKAGKFLESIPYYEKACGADILQACFELGATFEHLGKSKNALMKYQNSCHFGYLQSCYAMAMMYKNGVDSVDSKKFIESKIAKNITKATRILNEACLNNHAKSCYTLGMMYRNGDGLQANRLKAKDLFERGCNLSDSHSCKEYKILNSANFNLLLEDYVK